jgi:hypothetical protein
MYGTCQTNPKNKSAYWKDVVCDFEKSSSINMNLNLNPS